MTPHRSAQHPKMVVLQVRLLWQFSPVCKTATAASLPRLTLSSIAAGQGGLSLWPTSHKPGNWHTKTLGASPVSTDHSELTLLERAVFVSKPVRPFLPVGGIGEFARRTDLAAVQNGRCLR